MWSNQACTSGWDVSNTVHVISLTEGWASAVQCSAIYRLLAGRVTRRKKAAEEKRFLFSLLKACHACSWTANEDILHTPTSTGALLPPHSATVFEGFNGEKVILSTLKTTSIIHFIISLAEGFSDIIGRSSENV
jgi:hypothetical protein